MQLAERGGLLSALRHRDFRLLMTAFSVSAAGSWAYNVGLAVFIWDQTQSPTWLAVATVGRFVPSLLFGAYGGVLAERFERVRLMAAIDWLGAILMALLAVAAAVQAPVILAIVLAALTSVAGVIYEPAVAAVTPQAVPEDDLAAANTPRSTVDNLAVIVGPAIGAALLLVGPPSLAFAVNAASFAWSGLVVARMRIRSRPVDVTEGGKVGPLKQMQVGVRAIASSATAATLVAYSVIASFVYGVDTVQFVVLSAERLGTGADGFGYLLAGLGVGGIAAAALVNRLSARARLGGVILLGMALYCLPTLLFLVVDDPVSAFVIQVARGAETVVVDVLAITALQRSVPADVLGRVFGAFFTLVLSAISLGALLTPATLSATSLDTTIWLAGAALPALCLLGWPWLRRMDESNALRLAQLEPRIAVLKRAGILAETSRAVLERLAAASAEMAVALGQIIVREGEQADALYVVADGEFTVSARGEAGAETALPAFGGPGAYFGEIGLLEDIPRTATVTAAGPGRLLGIEGGEFLDALTSAAASPLLLEGAKTRLARTHPPYRRQTAATAT